MRAHQRQQEAYKSSPPGAWGSSRPRSHALGWARPPASSLLVTAGQLVRAMGAVRVTHPPPPIRTSSPCSAQASQMHAAACQLVSAVMLHPVALPAMHMQGGTACARHGHAPAACALPSGCICSSALAAGRLQGLIQWPRRTHMHTLHSERAIDATLMQCSRPASTQPPGGSLQPALLQRPAACHPAAGIPPHATHYGTLPLQHRFAPSAIWA